MNSSSLLWHQSAAGSLELKISLILHVIHWDNILGHCVKLSSTNFKNLPPVADLVPPVLYRKLAEMVKDRPPIFLSSPRLAGALPLT